METGVQRPDILAEVNKTKSKMARALTKHVKGLSPRKSRLIRRVGTDGKTKEEVATQP